VADEKKKTKKAEATETKEAKKKTEASTVEAEDHWYDRVLNGWYALSASIILWMLGFKSFRDFGEMAATGVEGVVQMIKSIFGRTFYAGLFLIVAIIVSAFFAYHDDGGVAVFLFTVSCILLELYVALVFFASVLLAGMRYDIDQKQLHVEQYVTKWLIDIGKCFQHALAWNFLILMGLLLYEPWKDGHQLHTVALLAASQIALFIISEKTRKLVRKYSTKLAFLVGLVCIIAVSWSHLMAAIDWIMDRPHVARACNEVSVSPLTFEDQLMDTDFNGEWSLIDADVIEQDLSTRDSTSRLYLERDGKKYLVGDYDGNGDVDTLDAQGFRRYLNGKGAAPSPLNTRQYIALKPSPKPNVDKPATKPTVDTTTQHVSSRAQDAVEQRQPTKPSNVSAQHTSLVTSNKAVTKKQFRNNPVPTAGNSFPLALDGDEPFFNTQVEGVSRNGQYVVIPISWSNPVGPEQQTASVHRSYTRLINTLTKKKYPLAKYTGFPLGETPVISPIVKTKAELYFLGNIPVGEYTLELYDHWHHKFTAKIVV